jgi:putative cell wall-binding protein
VAVRRSVVAGVLAVVVLAGAAPAGAGPGSRAPRPDPRTVLEQLVDPQLGQAAVTSDPAALVREARSGAGPVALEVLLLLAGQLGQPALGLRAPAEGRAQPPSGSSGGSSGGASGGVVVGGPLLVGIGPVDPLLVGDLDGDGGDDVLEVAFEGSGFVLTARRGTDGSAIWIAPQPDAVAGGLLQVAGDVDGDGRRDLLSTTVEVLSAGGSSECTPDACRDEFEESVRTTSTALDGASGTPLWSTTAEGSVRQTFAEDEGGFRFTTELRGQLGPLVPAGDVDGDGGADLIGLRTDLTTSESREQASTGPAVTTTTQTSEVAGVSELDLLRGTTGQPVRGTSGGPHVALLAAPVPDVDGDAVADLLVTRLAPGRTTRTCTEVVVAEVSCEDDGTPPTAGVAVLGGADLAEVWGADGRPSTLSAGAPADLSGDGAVDVLVSELVFDESQGSARSSLTALDGASGEERWVVDVDEEEPDGDAVVLLDLVQVLGATPLEDDAGTDVLAVRTTTRVDEAQGEFEFDTEVLAVDGEDGAVLRRTAVAGDNGGGAALGSRMVQGDDDGRGDVLVQTRTFRDDGSSTSTAVVVDATTGTELLRRDDPAGGVLRVLGDVDGDGADEATVDADLFGLQGEDGPRPLDVLRLAGGDVLWSRPQPFDGVAALRPAGRLRPDAPGLDLLADRLIFVGDTLQVGLTAHAGDDGTPLWSVPEPVAVRRVAGPDRAATAAALSADVHERTDTVVLARGDAWPDAITGAPLAAALDGPLLLSGTDALGPATSAEIRRLGARRAVLLGGEAAIGPAVAAELAGMGLAVERVAGDTRFATAAAVARRLRAEGADTSRVSVVRGVAEDPAQGWADAIAASAAGAAAGHPVLLSAGADLPEPTASALRDLVPARALLVGGPAAVPAEVEQAVRGLGVPTLRVAGEDRYATARAVAQLAVDEGVVVSTAWLATGLRFPDALAAAAAAGSGGVLLLTPGDAGDDTADALSFIGVNRAALREVVLVGGPEAIDPAVEARLVGVLGS